ncbi:MAG: chemotaxis protein CheW [Tissierellia bacterium]|nr:chemotaxis protein CheW [Tissierellia bacterium]
MSSGGDNRYVVFKLNQEYYGLPIEKVISIEKIGEITRIPNAPDYIKGVINLRGEVIPVVNLKRKLNIGDNELNMNSRIIVVNEDEMVVGLVVDFSSEVLEIDREDIDKPPETKDNQLIEYISGIGKTSDRLIIILDLLKILMD